MLRTVAFLLSLSILQIFVITATLKLNVTEDDLTEEDPELKFKCFPPYGSRLTKSIKPVHYDIKLILIDSDNFFGEVNISLIISKKTKNMKFHSDRLGINHQAIVLTTDYNGTVYNPTSFSYDVHMQENNIFFNDWLLPKRYHIFIKFTGTISNEPNDKEGFFKSSRMRDGNERIWMIATFFRGIGARRVFPCWDEPALRATFKINVKHPQHYTALSNVLLSNRSTSIDGIVWTNFDISPPMSPFHITIMLYQWSSFYTITPKDASMVMLVPTLIDSENAKFALDVADYIMDYLRERHHDTKWWKAPRLSHIVVPNFPPDITENNAHAIYRTTEILYDEKLDTTDHKLKIARLVARKMAHYWLGNAFTPDTWSYLWIAESLCMLLAMNALTDCYPKLRIMDYTLIQMRHDSLHLDTYGVMKPILMDVIPVSSDTLFASQYYTKALLIMRMLESVIGSEILWYNVENYLSQEPPSKSSNDRNFLDFCSYIENNMKIFNIRGYLHIPFNDVMHVWVTHSSYPVLHITRDYNTGQAMINLLLTNSSARNPSLWYIYVSYATETNPTFQYKMPPYRTALISPYQENSTFTPDDIDDWIIVNLQQIGYYRVHYDERNWLRLARYLNNCEYHRIHVFNRAQIVDDAYFLMMEGYLDFSLFLKLTEFLGTQERDYVAWYPMIKIFEYMSGYFPYQRSSDFRMHMEHILDEAIRHIGYKEIPLEDELTKCLREELYKWACVINNSYCRTMAYTELVNYLRDPEQHEFVPGMKEWTLCNGLKSASSDSWYKILDMWRVKRDNKLLQLLACSNDVSIICNYLKLAMSDSNITKMNPTDHINSFVYVIARHSNNDVVLKFILDNIKFLKPREISMVATFAIIINNMYTEEQLELVNKSAQDREKTTFLEYESLIQLKIEERQFKIRDQLENLEKLSTEKSRRTSGI